MNQLAESQCEPCRSGGPRVSGAERQSLLALVPQWQLRSVEGVERLERSFEFRDFRQALAFSNQVGALAEEQGHHPRLVTEWGRVTVQWWTHRIGGLHRNDFVMAAKTDALAAGGTQRG